MSLFSKLFSNKRRQDGSKKPDGNIATVEETHNATDEGLELLQASQHEETETPRDEVLMIEQGGFIVKEMYGTSEGKKYEIPSYKLPGLDLFEESGQLQDGYIHLAELYGDDKYQNTEYALPCVVGKTEEGDVCCFDLARMSNVLIAGSMGTGNQRFVTR